MVTRITPNTDTFLRTELVVLQYIKLYRIGCYLLLFGKKHCQSFEI